MKCKKIIVVSLTVLLLVGINLSVHFTRKQCPARSYTPTETFPKQVSLIEYKRADAIPAWGRRYNADCTMCHTMIPNLNAAGHKFRRLGYQMPDEFDNQKEAAISWDELSKLTNYFAVRGRAGAFYTRQSGANTFSFSDAGVPPPDATLFYAGPASRNLSFFYEFAFDPDAAAVEVAQMMFHEGNSNRFFFAKAGKFHDFGKVGFGGLDRPMTLSTPKVRSQFINGYRPNMDVIGFETGYSWGNFTGLIQASNGIKQTGDSVGGEVDPNNHKDIGLLLEYMIPGHDASVSALFNYGQAPTPTDSGGTVVPGALSTKYARGYLFADYTFEPIGLRPIVGVSIGSDNQFISNIGKGIVGAAGGAALTSASRSTSWLTFLEFDQRIKDNLYGIARFDYFDPTNTAEASKGTAKTWAGTGALAWSVQSYLRLVGEYSLTDNSFQEATHKLQAEVQMNF